MNKRLTAKERGLVKGALRRVFSRSDLRKQALVSATINHVDLKRPRVTKWGLCPICNTATPLYLMDVDHEEPLIPLNRSLEEMTWDEVIDRLWCPVNNLRAICKPCHTVKSKAENAKRRKFKKDKAK